MSVSSVGNPESLWNAEHIQAIFYIATAPEAG